MLILGSALLAVTVALLIIWAVNGSETLMTVITVLGLIGAFFSAVGTISLAVDKNGQRKLDRLRNEGVRYDAEISGMPTSRLIGNKRSIFLTVRAECSYTDDDGKVHQVRSRAFLVFFMNSNTTDYEASVFVNRSDPSDYFVEVVKRR